MTAAMPAPTASVLERLSMMRSRTICSVHALLVSTRGQASLSTSLALAHVGRVVVPVAVIGPSFRAGRAGGIRGGHAGRPMGSPSGDDNAVQVSEKGSAGRTVWAVGATAVNRESGP